MKNLQLIYYRALAELKIESKKAYLGIVWWLLDPLLYLVIFYIVFELVFKRGGEGFVAFLLCGLVFWRWFDSSVRVAANSINKERVLMSQVYLSKIVLPSTMILTSAVKFLFVLALFLVFLVLTGNPVTEGWLYLPVLMILQFMLIVGVGLFLSALIPFFPDLMIFVNYGMTFMFFLSGIFFDIGEVDGPVKAVLYLNPMAILIEGYRNAMINNISPLSSYLLYVLSISVILCIAGYLLLKRNDLKYPRIAE